MVSVGEGRKNNIQIIHNLERSGAIVLPLMLAFANESFTVESPPGNSSSAPKPSFNRIKAARAHSSGGSLCLSGDFMTF